MPLLFTSYDISDIDDVDAIVNIESPDQETVKELQDKLYRTAGSDVLMSERKAIGEIAPGQAVFTSAFNLPAKYIIYTLGPDKTLEKQEALDILTSCYGNSLKKAAELGCESVALPLYNEYGSGLLREDVLQTALDVFDQFLLDSDMDIYYMLPDRPLNEDTKADTEQEPSNGVIIEGGISGLGNITFSITGSMGSGSASIWKEPNAENGRETRHSETELNAKRFRERIDKEILSPGKFSIYLYDLMEKKGLKSSDVWRGANMNSQTFSKITNELLDYHTTKNNVIALALSMKLSLDEMEDLLMYEGYALSPYDDSDVCVKLYVESGHYDVTRLNILRYDLGMSQLGQTKARKGKKNN